MPVFVVKWMWIMERASQDAAFMWNSQGKLSSITYSLLAATFRVVPSLSQYQWQDKPKLQDLLRLGGPIISTLLPPAKISLVARSLVPFIYFVFFCRLNLIHDSALPSNGDKGTEKIPSTTDCNFPSICLTPTGWIFFSF